MVSPSSLLIGCPLPRTGYMETIDGAPLIEPHYIARPASPLLPLLLPATAVSSAYGRVLDHTGDIISLRVGKSYSSCNGGPLWPTPTFALFGCWLWAQLHVPMAIRISQVGSSCSGCSGCRSSHMTAPLHVHVHVHCTMYAAQLTTAEITDLYYAIILHTRAFMPLV